MAVALLMTMVSISRTPCVSVRVCTCMQMARYMEHEEAPRPSFSPKLASGCCQPLVIPSCRPVHLMGCFIRCNPCHPRVDSHCWGLGVQITNMNTHTYSHARPHSHSFMHAWAHTLTHTKMLTCKCTCSHTRVPSVSNQLRVKWGSKHRSESQQFRIQHSLG